MTLEDMIRAIVREEIARAAAPSERPIVPRGCACAPGYERVCREPECPWKDKQ